MGIYMGVSLFAILLLCFLFLFLILPSFFDLPIHSADTLSRSTWQNRHVHVKYLATTIMFFEFPHQLSQILLQQTMAWKSLPLDLDLHTLQNSPLDIVRPDLGVDE